MAALIRRRPFSSRRRPPDTSIRCAGDAGFTLIETVAAMAILGLLMAVVVPSLPLAVSRPQVEGLALAIAAVLNGDHQAAMSRHTLVASVVDAKRRTVDSGSRGRSVALPDGIAVTSVLAKTCLGAPVVDRIVFLPDGTSCGGTVVLEHDSQRVEVRVNWLTGATELVSGTR